MTCYHPLKAFQIGFHTSGKPEYKISGYDTDHVEYYNGCWHNALSDSTSKYCEDVQRDFIEIPCGKCVGCRLDYSRQWADRCMLEMKYHKSSYFVTLTYDDKHVPTTEFFNNETGEIHSIMNLSKRDFQLFMKRLRKAYALKHDNKLRFFMAGEYGGETFRPHYHAIIFGLELDDLKFYKQSKGNILYNSPWLESIWDKGYVVVAPANWESCAYTARYILKKISGSDGKYITDSFGIQPEFSLMSRKPGIGRQFFDDHNTNIFETDCIYISTPDGSKEIRPPRYYKKLLDFIDPVKYIELKEVSLVTQSNIHYQKLLKTSQSYLEMLATEEDVKLNRIKALKRGDM